jgi:hypothetical protein
MLFLSGGQIVSLKVLGGVKSTLDVVVTVAMGIASVMLVWHLTRSPGETGREGGAPAIEDVSGNGESISMKDAAAKGRDSAPLVLVE